jgi:NAD(P)-dependent dehydrogenase (short-subunit alcohol dehydrogenase family)
MDLHLTGKVAVVTGASRGIGLAVTQALANEGVTVVAGARGHSAELSALADGGRRQRGQQPPLQQFSKRLPGQSHQPLLAAGDHPVGGRRL